MKAIIYIIILFLFCPVVRAANSDKAEQESTRVIYEDPTEDDVVTVHSSEGYCTILEFPEKPLMVAVGDSSLIKIEVPANSKTVLIKPLAAAGKSNLFVYTKTRRFNYKVQVGEVSTLDYVIDVRKTMQEQIRSTQSAVTKELLKTVKNYSALEKLGAIKQNLLTRKLIFTQQENDYLVIKFIEGFIYKKPHNLIIHCLIQNKRPNSITFNEGKTYLYANGKKFRPSVVSFDAQVLAGMKETDVWLIISNSYISLENKFTLGLGLGEKEYVFKETGRQRIF